MSTNLVPIGDIERMAIAVAGSKLFGMKTKEEAIALMLIAQSEGLHPARAAMEYHIIQGRPALKADAMLSRFQQAGGKVEWVAYTDDKVEGIFSHPSGGNVTIDWTIERAKQAGVYGKNPVWKTYPRSMLRARCISEGIRTIYPGVSVGIYTPEEVQDFTGENAKDVTPAEEKSEENKVVQMPEKVKAAVKARPVIDSTAVEVPSAKGTISGNPDEGRLDDILPLPIADDVLEKVLAAFAEIGYSKEQTELEYGKPVSEWLDRDIPDIRETLKALRTSKSSL